MNLSWLFEKHLVWRKAWLFSWPDASCDRCQELGCGVERKMHGRGHKFLEHASKQEKPND